MIRYEVDAGAYVTRNGERFIQLPTIDAASDLCRRLNNNLDRTEQESRANLLQTIEGSLRRPHSIKGKAKQTKRQQLNDHEARISRLEKTNEKIKSRHDVETQG